jgi:xanthine dehydrogenase accessory factor
MDDPILALQGLLSAGEPVALSSLIGSSGSIPMSERAKMIVDAGGRAHGTIGGGCLEAEIHTVARDVLASGRPQSTDYTMTEKQAGEHGLNCGGTVRIYTERIEPDSGDIFAEVAAARADRSACVLVTPLGGAGRALLHADGRRRGDLDAVPAARLSSWALTALERERPSLENAEAGEFFVEPFTPPPMLYVFGGGHVGGQIARLARNVGFRVILVDDRPYFANPERHPEVDECVADEVDAVFSRVPADDQIYIVAATRGHQHDEIVVEHAIARKARYIGMLGSERKKVILWQRIEARGGDRRRLEEVYAPVGLDIGADTPEEIAVSVVAELIQVRRSERRKRWKTKRTAARAAPRG